MSFLDKYKPVFAPEVEAGSEPDAGTTPPPSTGNENQQPDGPGSGRSRLRQDLERGFADARKAVTVKRDQESGKFKKGDQVGSRLSNLPDSGGGQAPQEAEDNQVNVGVDNQVNDEGEVGAAPEGWAAEAKELWAQLPPTVRAAVLKREEDGEKGVKALKAKYAELDQILGPRAQVIQSYGKTPAQAVDQLFAWFDALGANPDVAFPALAKSFGYDLRRLMPRPQQRPQAQQQQPGNQQPANAQGQPQEGQQPLIDPRVQSWLQQQFGGLQQRYQQLESQLQANNQAKTEEALAIWSKDKPHYEDVRERMAYLIGSGAVPLKDGKVDLDGAYDAAVWSMPEVRAKIVAEQNRAAAAAAKAKQEAERKAQAEQAEKARRAATSVPISAPGLPAQQANGQTRKGKSVKETLMEAIETHREQ